ncbi:MAG: hypothetical protein C5B52_18690 [Bacteroidetes bacterium]|nr:MAG: hypothetical protein C5B52_18690 [Bacteroidota bacterium]
MKNYLITGCLLMVVFVSCSSGANQNAAAEKKDTVTLAAPIVYPFNAEYSSNFTTGDPKNSKLVLDLFMAWRDGRTKDLRQYYADTVNADFADGNHFSGTGDSLAELGAKIREEIQAMDYKITAWMPVHAVDKNEDWVFVWYELYETHKDGSKDSTQSHGMYQVKNGRISYWGEYDQKFPAAEK